MDCIVLVLSYVSPVHIGSCWALCYLYCRHPSIGRICQESWWWLVSLPPGSIISATSATGQFIIIVINIPSMQCRRVRSRKTERMASTNAWVIQLFSLQRLKIRLKNLSVLCCNLNWIWIAILSTAQNLKNWKRQKITTMGQCGAKLGEAKIENCRALRKRSLIRQILYISKKKKLSGWNIQIALR